ncbi:MAG: tetratricopeptide repeat protein [Myxococcales bacterium]|nr:tetratricopeptide repeat protein [Myxococcales bacterium]MDD9966168.1 tetratricopeptide repeat protein [Myxococcales bacterium]
MAEPQQGGGGKSAGRSAGARLAAKRAAKAARKAAKRGTDNLIEDEVAETVERANSWLDDHQRLIWGSVAVIGVVGIIAVSLTMHSDKVSRDGATLLWDGVEASLAPISADGAASSDDDAMTYGSIESRAQAALKPFRETQHGFPGTDAARWARLGEANALMEQGKPQQALKAYDEVAAAASGYLKFAGLEGAAFALEAEEKLPEAIKRYERAGSVAGGAYKPVAEYQTSRLLALSGKQDEAVKRLQAMLEAEREKATSEEEHRPVFEQLKRDADTLLRELGVTPEGDDLKIDLGAAKTASGAPDIEALKKLVETQLKNKQPAADPSTGEGDRTATGAQPPTTGKTNADSEPSEGASTKAAPKQGDGP